MNFDVEKYIKELEGFGLLDPSCEFCQRVHYPHIRAGNMLSSLFAPSHKARKWCKSGGKPHCTCRECF